MLRSVRYEALRACFVVFMWATFYIQPFVLTDMIFYLQLALYTLSSFVVIATPFIVAVIVALQQRVFR
jgi:hypothetical protein